MVITKIVKVKLLKGEIMSEQVLPKDKRFVSIRQYQRISGMSYDLIKFALDTNQLKAIKSECGHYKIDTQAEFGADISILMDKLNEMDRKISALTRQFNTATT